MTHINLCEEAKMYRKRLGDKGEEFVRQFLKKNGFEVLASQFRVRSGEVDIVAYHRQKTLLIFTEVKLRTTDEFGTADAQCTKRKLARMKIAGREFILRRGEKLREEGYYFTHIRYDFCAISVRQQDEKNGKDGGRVKKKWKLTYYEGVG